MHTVAAQRHRVNRAINFARSRVRDALDLESMADVACLSKYHFTRVFNAHLNETPGQYLVRIRLELAARKLIYTQRTSMTQIAMDCGFSGSDTFSRAFRARFGSAPRIFRTSNQWCLETIKATHPLSKEIHKPGEMVQPDALSNLRVRIEPRPDYRVAYIRHVGPYGDINNTISDTFSALQRWAARRGILRSDTSYIGLCTDNSSITPARHCTYDACLVLEDDIPEDDIVSIQTIPACICAVLYVECKPVQLNRYWTWLTSVWLPNGGTNLSFQPAYERFEGVGEKNVASDFGVELCMPLER